MGACRSRAICATVPHCLIAASPNTHLRLSFWSSSTPFLFLRVAKPPNIYSIFPQSNDIFYWCGAWSVKRYVSRLTAITGSSLVLNKERQIDALCVLAGFVIYNVVMEFVFVWGKHRGAERAQGPFTEVQRIVLG
jgi:hypothetical protein